MMKTYPPWAGEENKPTASQRVVGGDEAGASAIDRCACNIEICLSQMSALISIMGHSIMLEKWNNVQDDIM